MAKVNKPIGNWCVSRKIDIPSLKSMTDVKIVENTISKLPGIKKFTTDVIKNQAIVSYDPK